MRRTFLMSAMVAIVSAGALRAQIAAQERLIVVGAGKVGSWETEFELANPSPAPVTVLVNYGVGTLGVPCPPICPELSIEIPGNGSAFLDAGALGFGLFEVRAAQGMSLPVVTARWVNRADPLQTFELPAIRLSTLMDLNPAVLAFPGAQQTSGGARSNLVVMPVFPTQSSGLLIEAFSPSGVLLGSREFEAPQNGPLVVGRVLETLGLSDLVSVQVRVTRLAGDGPLWGFMATVAEDGSVRATAGQMP